MPVEHARTPIDAGITRRMQFFYSVLYRARRAEVIAAPA